MKEMSLDTNDLIFQLLQKGSQQRLIGKLLGLDIFTMCTGLKRKSQKLHTYLIDSIMIQAAFLLSAKFVF